MRRFLPWLSLLMSWFVITSSSSFDPPEDLYPANSNLSLYDEDHTYAVFLHKGYLIEDHWAKIGQDLSKTAQWYLGGWYPPFDIYHATIMDEKVVEAIRQDSGVEAVLGPETPSTGVWNFGPESSKPVDSPPSPPSEPMNSEQSQSWEIGTWQQVAYWHTKMLTHASKQDDLDAEKFYEYRTLTKPLAGSKVDEYFFGSGIQQDHELLKDQSGNSRVVNFVPYKWEEGSGPTDRAAYCPIVRYPDGTVKHSINDDWNGHETGMATIAASLVYGIAPNANVVNVKTGCEYGVFKANLFVAAIYDVMKAHTRKKFESPDWIGSVINFSGNDPPQISFWRRAMLKAFSEAYHTGIPIIAAADNDNINAEDISPCSSVHVFCVAAVDPKYNKAGFSNWGPAINGIAPGVDIISGLLHDRDGHWEYTYSSGTSGATATVTGIVSLFLSYEGPGLSGPGGAAKMYKRLEDNGIKDIVTGFPEGGMRDETHNLVTATGFDHPNRLSDDPYFIDHGELSLDELNKCQLNITELWTCQPAGSNKYARVSVSDANGNHVFGTPESTNPPVVPIDGPWLFKEPGMSAGLEMAANSNWDYITIWVENKNGGSWKFWTASNKEPNPWQETGQCWLDGDDWDLANGPPGCWTDSPGQLSRQFVCRYPCDG